MKMEGEVAISRHFFIVMVPDYQNHLDLPSSICKKLKEEKSERAILKSRIGEWKMDVCINSSNGLICFKNGWPQFVDHHDLSIGDFIVFEHIGEFHFNVSVFDHTACEKEFPFESKKELQENNQRESDEKAKVPPYQTLNPHFVLTMKPSFAQIKPGVNIPAEFVRSTNLRKKTSVTIRDPHRRSWPVSLVLEKKGRLRVLFGKGWCDFYVSNELKLGDVCLFELNCCSQQSPTDDDALMDVQIFRAPV